MWIFDPVKTKKDNKDKNPEVYNEEKNIEQKEREVKLHEQSFEKTSWTDSLKTFEWNSDFPLYNRIKWSFVDMKMSSLKRNTVLDLTNSLWYKIDFNEIDEKLNTPEINKKFVILSIVDVVNTLKIEKEEQSSLRDDLIWVWDLDEWDENNLHFTEDIDDPDYPLLKWLEKNKDLNLSEIETKAIWEHLWSTETIIEAIESVSDEIINQTRKQEIISKINDIHEELNKENVWLPDIFVTFPSLVPDEWKQDNVINLIWSNYAQISWWDWKNDIDTAINIWLNKILYKKVIPNRYSELMQKNITIIRDWSIGIREKVSALRVIFHNVNGVMWFSWKTMDKIKARIDDNKTTQDENLEEMYKNVLKLLKNHSDNEKNKFEKQQDSAKKAWQMEKKDTLSEEQELDRLLAEFSENAWDTKA